MSLDEPNQDQLIDEHDMMTQRRQKLSELRTQSVSAFPNQFRPDAFASELRQTFGDCTQESLQEQKIHRKIAGRMMTVRLMGKASFIHLQDMTDQIQVYIRRDDVGEVEYDVFKKWDLGDIISVEGFLFKTKTGELSIHAEQIGLLTKSLRPLPDKFHGLVDQESRYRQRYLDLLVNPSTRRVFQIRTQTIDYIRSYLKERHFMEVETPMMHVLAGGAAAKPFATHHNALDMELYLRIAPELYLKRLVIGGFDRVFEINRNFRNEGLSTRHNPEFTMLEFYQAYADYQLLMDLTEHLFRGLTFHVLGTQQITYQGQSIDFSKPFQRYTLKESILIYNPELTISDLDSREAVVLTAAKYGISVKPTDGLGKIQTELFEKTVEHRLVDPTFITAYPAEVSPLARRHDADPFITDRFELFIAGREIANGFSELNDSEDQALRFQEQMNDKAAGDEEAMPYDEDYITALEYGLPPTAGEGIGIDRLVMLLTDSASIREVILFPHLRSIR